LNKKEFSDVTLIVEGQQIFAHQVILASRSTYFEALFSHDFSEKDLRVVDFNDSGITYNQLMSLLRHIYSDNIKIESKSIYDLLSLADRYDIQSIKRKCENIFA
jgi:CRISPR/Cas system CSM-associated protein Csm5 (group 7 of RAMP superfamily)